ncbi:MAG: hypothetical protein HY749_18700 [Gammaproteobacteria bacterium]|nr:hypothetical protein [Gammaproteobacteria bacterium]
MLPDIDLRLETISTTLRDIVLPVVPMDESLAREHVQLMIAHLAMIKAQWKHALAFELGTYDAQRTLARELIGALDESALRAALDAALRSGETLDRSDYEAVNRALKTLAALLDRAILEHNAGAAVEPRLAAAVLAYGKREAWRYRVWFQGAGVDPDRAELPEIAALFA